MRFLLFSAAFFISSWFLREAETSDKIERYGYKRWGKYYDNRFDKGTSG